MTQDTAPKRAVIYARKSNDRTGAGLGVTKQEDDCRQLAAQMGLEVVGVRTDNDTTAARESSRYRGRPGFEDLLGDIRSGHAEAVLAWHEDRLLRDMGDLETYIKACRITDTGDGVPTYTVRSGHTDLSNASGRMMARIKAAVHQEEVEHMIERQKSAKERIRNAGGWHGGRRVFGFRQGTPISRGGDGGLVLVPAEADAIRQACEAVLRDGVNVELGHIAREFNRVSGEGFGKFHTTSVKRVLTAPRIAGLIAYKGKVVREGKWEPIVSEDTWRAVTAILSGRSRKGVTENPGPAPTHLLSGTTILICGVCGGTKFASITQKARDRAPYRIYLCGSLRYKDDDYIKALGTSRFHLSRGADTLDEFVESIVRKRLSDPAVVAAFIAPPEVDLAALDKRRQEINGELDEIACSRFPMRQKNAMAEPMLIELAEIEQKVSAALRGNPLPEFTGASDPVAAYDAMPVERKRAVIRLMMRIRLQRAGLDGNSFDYDSVEILPPE